MAVVCPDPDCMQYIDQAQANFLYENIETILRTEGLSEKERIPKYRTILESLFRQLTADEKRYLDNLSARIAFITTEYNTPQEIKNLAHHLRIFANDVVHNMGVQPGPPKPQTPNPKPQTPNP